MTVSEIVGKTAQEIFGKIVPRTRKVGNVPLSADIPVTLTGDAAITVTNTGTASAIGYSVAHNDSGVTAGSKGDTANQTPGFGETFKTLSATVDAKGHITALSEHSNKIPDTKATTSADGLMSKEDKVKLDKYASKGSAAKGVYIDANGSPQPMTHELNADVPENFAPATAAPLIDGTAAAGSSAKYAREDHVHPTDTSRASAVDVSALQAENALLRELINGIDAPIYRNASGNPATFDDGAAANVKSLFVTITPSQSGEGDPSPDNIRPISGVSSVSAACHNAPSDSVTIAPSQSGEGDPSPDNIRPITPGLSFTRDNNDPLTVYGGTLNVTTGKLTVTHMLISLTGAETTGVVGNNGNTITVEHGAAYVGPDTAYTETPDMVCSHYPAIARGTLIGTANIVGVCLFGSRSEKIIFSSAAPVTPAEFSRFLSEQYAAGTPVQVAVPFKTPVTYQLTPAETRRALNALGYDGDRVTVPLVDSNTDPLTVYGGTLDVTTGELTVTSWLLTESDFVRGGTSGGGLPYYNAILTASYLYDSSKLGSILCNMLKTMPNPDNAWYSRAPCITVGGTNAIRIYESTETELSAFQAKYAGLQAVYPLATPLTYNLTPAQLATLSGYNRVTTDAETLSVTYRADTKLSLGGG